MGCLMRDDLAGFSEYGEDELELIDQAICESFGMTREELARQDREFEAEMWWPLQDGKD